MRMTYKALLLLLLLLSPGLGWAQDPDGKDALAESKQKLLTFAANNDDFDRRVEGAARDTFRGQIGCQVVDQAVRQLPTLYGSMRFPASVANKFPAPEHGIWAEHVKIRGCGKLWQINLLAVAQVSANPMLLSLLPGETLSDPGAQGEAERVAATSIRKSNPTCADEPKTYYTRFLGFRTEAGAVGATNTTQGWFEEWDFKFCQKEIAVQMAFLPNTTGGFDIKTRLNNAANPGTPAGKPDVPAATSKTP